MSGYRAPSFSGSINGSVVIPGFHWAWKGLVAGGAAWHKPLRNIVTGDVATTTLHELAAGLGGGLRVNALTHVTKDDAGGGSILPAVDSGDIGNMSAFVLDYPQTTVSTSFGFIIVTGGTAANDPHAGIAWDSTDEHLSFINQTIIESAAGSVPANEWYTAGITVDDTANDKIGYLNGVQVAQDGTVTSHDHSAIGISRRYDGSGSNRHGGQIAVWYLWNRVLSPGEMLLVHQFPFGLLTEDPRRLVKAAAVGVANPHNPLGHPLYGPFAGPVAA